jgi:hypothetical protein
VVSIGLHPSIAQFNGFKTVDGYFQLYPLDYKHEFRKIIEKEISRNNEVELYFDNWGSRFYIFSSEMQCPRNDDLCLLPNSYSIDINLNTAILSSMNVKYILSVPKIKNWKELGLSEIGVIVDESSSFIINLYRLN